jgi:hypothetical protein
LNQDGSTSSTNQFQGEQVAAVSEMDGLDDALSAMTKVLFPVYLLSTARKGTEFW